MNHWCNVTAKKVKAILGYINKIRVLRKRGEMVSIWSDIYSNWGLFREKITRVMEGLEENR